MYYNIIVDSGFWFGLYEERDQHHNKAIELVDYLDKANIIIPFPCLYEMINTRFTKRIEYMESFRNLIERDNVLMVNDAPYKDIALKLTMDASICRKKQFSLVDMIIRLMISDVNMDIHYLMTFNKGDFIDICMTRNIIILS
jgi:predicted nucleic acid-binding protein